MDLKLSARAIIAIKGWSDFMCLDVCCTVSVGHSLHNNYNILHERQSTHSMSGVKVKNIAGLLEIDI